MDDFRNVLFDVFTSTTGGKFAIGETADKDTVVIEMGTPENGAHIKKTTRVLAIRTMGEKLKRGYVRGRASMYFDPVEQVFTYCHPDLYWGGKKWVLASNPPSLAQGIEAITRAMSNVDPALISQVEINAWAARQTANAAYIVAFDDLPVWSLVVAETALQSGWPVRSNPQLKGAPKLLPSTNPIAWIEWLTHTFDTKKVREAQTLLGFTFDNTIQSDQQTLIEEGNWSSLI